MGIYLTVGIIIAAYMCWLVFWLDVLETVKSKRKPMSDLEEVTLGGLAGAVGAFLFGVVLWPIMFIIAVGMTWEEFELGKIVIWKRGDDDISLKGIDD